MGLVDPVLEIAPRSNLNEVKAERMAGDPNDKFCTTYGGVTAMLDEFHMRPEDPLASLETYHVKLSPGISLYGTVVLHSCV